MSKGVALSTKNKINKKEKPSIATVINGHGDISSPSENAKLFAATVFANSTLDDQITLLLIYLNILTVS